MNHFVYSYVTLINLESSFNWKKRHLFQNMIQLEQVIFPQPGVVSDSLTYS